MKLDNVDKQSLVGFVLYNCPFWGMSFICIIHVLIEAGETSCNVTMINAFHAYIF